MVCQNSLYCALQTVADLIPVCVSQSELRASEGEVPGRGAMQAWEGIGGVLRAGPAAAPAPQRQLQSGQGLHHETHHQLPAHEETAQLWSVLLSFTESTTT